MAISVSFAGVVLERQQLRLRTLISRSEDAIDEASHHQQRLLLKINRLASAPRILDELENLYVSPVQETRTHLSQHTTESSDN
tara:strand:+ start:241 stop:489 length:249 start_codon:yes stop_codon:yes gene_type:complete